MTAPSDPRLSDPQLDAAANARWCLAELAGRLVELTGWRASALYSSALDLVSDAQRNAEPAAWIGPCSRVFFPPDAAANGVDLCALPVVRVRVAREIPFAADVLARSGAFGLLVLDLGGASLSLGELARLAGLARAHESAIVLLCEKPADRASSASVVSLRADTSFARVGEAAFEHTITVARDRRRGASWRRVELRNGPPGLS